MSAHISAASEWAILHSLNLPIHYVIYDGRDYWMVAALGPHGWRDRRPYRGHVDYLIVCSAWTRKLLPDFPTEQLVGYGAPEQVGARWKDVRAAG